MVVLAKESLPKILGYRRILRPRSLGDAVTLLLKRGASISARNAQGQTPLINAVLGGNSDFVRELLKRGADVNAKDHAGRSATWYANVANQVAGAKVLREFGAK